MNETWETTLRLFKGTESQINKTANANTLANLRKSRRKSGWSRKVRKRDYIKGYNQMIR